MSATMFKLYVDEVKLIRLEHVSIDFAAAWSYSIVCDLIIQVAPPTSFSIFRSWEYVTSMFGDIHDTNK